MSESDPRGNPRSTLPDAVEREIAHMVAKMQSPEARAATLAAFRTRPRVRIPLDQRGDAGGDRGSER
jgi:hypothetical protein